RGRAGATRARTAGTRSPAWRRAAAAVGYCTATAAAIFACVTGTGKRSALAVRIATSARSGTTRTTASSRRRWQMAEHCPQCGGPAHRTETLAEDLFECRDRLKARVAELEGDAARMRQALAHAKAVAWEGPAHRAEWEDHSQALFDGALASGAGAGLLAER